MAAQLSHRLGLIDLALVDRLTALIARAGLPIVGPALGVDRYIEMMKIDKKSEGGQIKFVVIDKPGSAAVMRAPGELVAQVITDCCRGTS